MAPGTALPDEVTYPAGASLTLVAVPFDEEDDPADCEEVQWTLSIGHNAHAHPERTGSGCTFTIEDTTLPPHTEDPDDVVFWALEAAYTDGGGEDGSIAGLLLVGSQPLVS